MPAAGKPALGRLGAPVREGAPVAVVAQGVREIVEVVHHAESIPICGIYITGVGVGNVPGN